MNLVMALPSEARQKYGDKAVDAVLKHEVELAGLQKEALAAGAP
jgi:hypothetical protein